MEHVDFPQARGQEALLEDKPCHSRADAHGADGDAVAEWEASGVLAIDEQINGDRRIDSGKVFDCLQKDVIDARGLGHQRGEIDGDPHASAVLGPADFAVAKRPHHARNLESDHHRCGQ